MNSVFQVVVQILVRVKVRRVGREIKHLDAFFVLLQPFLNGGTMMNPQIVHDQEYFSSCSFYQTLHKCDQKVAVHGFAIKHESDPSFIGNGGNHADTALLDTEAGNRAAIIAG